MTHLPRRAGAALVALLAGLFAVIAFQPAAHAAALPDPAAVLAEWKAGDPLYVESGSPLSSDQQSEITNNFKDAKSKIYGLAVPANSATEAEAGALIQTLGKELDAAGRPAATIAVFVGTRLYADSTVVNQSTLNRIQGLAIQNSGGDFAKGITEWTERVDLAATGKTRDALSPRAVSGGGGGTGVLLALGGLALVGGGGYFLYSRNVKKKRLEQEARDLAAVTSTVEEDVTKFGEEITGLDTDVTLQGEGGQHIGEWQQALDSYEKAKAQLAAVTKPDQIREVTQTLEDGRYALAVVKAKVNNQPIPERRAPCFFNPQHGPSVRDVRWAPPGGAVRDVPACASDAQAIEQGFDPQPREVMIHGQRVPYYNAGPAYQPYAYGYYGGFGDVMTGMFIGTMMGSMMFGGMGMGMGGYGAGYSEGYADGGAGDMGGGGDAGGWGDFGGGDFGGGDFGGGDW